MKKNVKLEVTLWGSIFNFGVKLENQYSIERWFQNKAGRIWYVDLPDYPIDGNSLEVELIAIGINGAYVDLKVFIDDVVQQQNLLAVVDGGRTQVSQSYNILTSMK